MCIITPKKSAEGVFERIKARPVVLGNLQTEDQLHTNPTSPTSSLQTIFVQAAIAAAKDRKVFTFDIGQAFLNEQLAASCIYPYRSNNCDSNNDIIIFSTITIINNYCK